MIRNLIYQIIGVAVMVVFSLTTAGCSNTWQGLKKDTKEVSKTIEKTYEKTKKKIKE